MRVTIGMVLDTIREGISYARKGDMMMAEVCRQSARRKIDDGQFHWAVQATNGYGMLKGMIDGMRGGMPSHGEPDYSGREETEEQSA